MAHRERVATREELLEQVWSDAHVAESSLYRAVTLLRRILGDGTGVAEPIELVRGRGYRFCAPVADGPAQTDPELVGRGDALAALAAALERARTGERQLVFVTGEAGIGKSSLIDAFARGRAGAEASVALGRCLGGVGQAGSISPLLEALGRVCRQRGAEAVEALQRHAPSWLLQLPGLSSSDDWERLEARTLGASRERMIEELAAGLEALSAARPLVLVLEDLHWADASTLSTLEALAQRPERARLLVVGSVRTGDPRGDDAPLRALIGELKAKGHCQELALAPLAPGEVTELVARHAGAVAPAIAALVAARCGGNPLFALQLTALLRERGADGTPHAVPDGVRELIERQLEALDAEAVALLESASAAGSEFSVIEVAAATGVDPEQIEERCEQLARRQSFLRRAGLDEWPDGTAAERYAFVHALFREVLYTRLRSARRLRTHRAIAARIEAGWGERAAEVCALLADHYDRAHEPALALPHYVAAIEDAGRRVAIEQARRFAGRALELAEALPAAERDASELRVRLALYSAVATRQGVEIEALLERCEELCERLGDRERLLHVLWARSLCRFFVGDMASAHALSQRLFEQAETLGRADYVILAHDSLATTCNMLARFEESQQHAERALALYDPRAHGRLADRLGLDVGTTSALSSAFSLWHLGQPERSCARMAEAIERARSAGHPYSLVVALCYAAGFHLGRPDRDAARACADEAASLAAEHRFREHAAFADLMLAASIAEPKPRLDAMLASLARVRAQVREPSGAGATLLNTLFAQALADVGARDPALAQVERALEAGRKYGEPHYEPTLHVLRARLALDDAERERALETAVSRARELGTRIGELVAAVELARLQQRTGRPGSARALLDAALAPFPPASDLSAVRDAQGLLAHA